MFRNLRTNKILWLLNALLTLVVATYGVINPNIYSRMVTREVLPGVVSQDWLTVVAALFMLFAAMRTREGELNIQIIALGILGYFFYAYGIYAIERIYNFLYIPYLVIFGLSFYSIAYGAATIRSDILHSVRVSNTVRVSSIVFSLFIAVFFSFLWVAMLVPLIQDAQKPEFFYSVFILDLSFIMPAFAILAWMAARKHGFGLLMTPALYVLGATLLLPVGLGEFIKPTFDQPMDAGGAILYLGISLLFFIAAAVYLRNLEPS
jgi:hypothetical protein